MSFSTFLRDAIGNLTHLLRCSSAKVYDTQCYHGENERHWPQEKKELGFLVQRPPAAFLHHAPESIAEIMSAFYAVEQWIVDRRGSENYIDPVRMPLFERYCELKRRRWLICSRVYKVGLDNSQQVKWCVLGLSEVDDRLLTALDNEVERMLARERSYGELGSSTPLFQNRLVD